jgi:hypothetical protein
MTATGERMRLSIVTAFGICCKAQTDLRLNSLVYQMTSLFQRLICRKQ